MHRSPERGYNSCISTRGACLRVFYELQTILEDDENIKFCIHSAIIILIRIAVYCHFGNIAVDY